MKVKERQEHQRISTDISHLLDVDLPISVRDQCELEVHIFVSKNTGPYMLKSQRNTEQLQYAALF